MTTSQSNSHSSTPLSVHNLDAKVNGSSAKKQKEAESNIPQPLVLEKAYDSTSSKKKEKKKKKKQKHVKETSSTNAAVVTSDPTSTTDIPDYSRSVCMAHATSMLFLLCYMCACVFLLFIVALL